MSASATAYVGLGANLDDPVQQLRAGMQALTRLPKTRLLTCASLYRSAPIGVESQPDFINTVCALETELLAPELMQRLLQVELEHGRVRGAVRGGPRTLDLDLLLYGAVQLVTPALTLPHPRMHQRAFVLAPLAEIAPVLVIPGLGSVQDLLYACAEQRVERLDSANIRSQ